MRQILFIADDLGLSDSINDAIFHTHLHGVLDGAALMMGQPGTASAVTRAHDLPQMQIGLHLHLVDSQPLTIEQWPWRTPTAAGFSIGLSARMRRLVREEIRAQWHAFEQTGLPCRFVSGHHHLHAHPLVRRMLIETLPTDFEGWVRWGTPRFFAPGTMQLAYGTLHLVLQNRKQPWPFKTSTTLWGLDRIEGMRAGEIEAVLPRLADGLHEFMFHPRKVEADADTTCLVELRGWTGRDSGAAHGPSSHAAPGG